MPRKPPEPPAGKGSTGKSTQGQKQKRKRKSPIAFPVSSVLASNTPEETQDTGEPTEDSTQGSEAPNPGAEDSTQPNPGGRPTDFRPEFITQAEKLIKLGATDMELADFFGVNVRTLYRWKATNEKFCHALKVSKEEADSRVERSLYQRAIGYEQDAVKIFLPKDSTTPVYAQYRERVQPDTTACIFWLKNRKPQDFRDKVDVEAKVETVRRVISDI